MNNYKLNSQDYTAIALIIGFYLTTKLSINEQNAFGNWIYLVAQVMDTNASIYQSMANANNNNNYNNFFNNFNGIDKDILNNIIKDIDLIKEKLKDIQKNE